MPWSRRSVMQSLNACPEDKEPIYEAVLAIWRLKMCSELGAKDPTWLVLMQAWMVCRRAFR